MRRCLTFVIVVPVGLTVLASSAGAQWMYPRGFGGYGMSRWGADPAPVTWRGWARTRRGQGVYQDEKAKADAINADTMIKWNKALRARQLALREEQRKEASSGKPQRQVRVEEMELKDGTTLNNLLFQILDGDPARGVRPGRRAPIERRARSEEIPFEWDSEAITLCLDQMTGTESLPRRC